MQMTEVRCCCNPSNLLGHVPMEAGEAAGLILRELQDDTMAFSGEGRPHASLSEIPGFERSPLQAMPHGPKTWKKTWRKK